MANKQKQMLAVWGSPGAGKTVTAVKLAAELAKRKKNVVLVFTDLTAPSLPAVAAEGKLPEVSVGDLLSAPGMTQERVLKTCVPCEKHPYISFLGYKAGENVFTYAEYSKEKAVDMLVLLRHIADYVIVDCTSVLTGNVLATAALEVADDVLRVCGCDLKAISYFASYLPLIEDRKFKPEQHIRVLSNTRPYPGGMEYENSFGGVKYRLPYLPIVEEQAATLKLLEPLSGKEAKSYEQDIAAIAVEANNIGLFFNTSKNTRPFAEVLAQVQEYLASKYSTLITDNPEEQRQQITAYIAKYLNDYSLGVEGMDHEALIDKLYTEMAEFSFLTPYLFASDVEEININSWKDTKITYADGRVVPSKERFQSPQHAVDVVRRLLHKSGMILDNSQPGVVGHLSNKIRITVLGNPLTDKDKGVAASIRIVNPKRLGRDDFVRYGTATAEMLDFLAAVLRFGLSICVTGSTGSGKTTLMSWILSTIPNEKRVFTIENGCREFDLVKEDAEGNVLNNVVHTVTRFSDDPKQNYDQERLLEFALTCDPDVVCVGEMKSAEAFAAQEAARTGHAVITTTHANSCKATYYRMVTLCTQKYDMGDKTLYNLVTEAFPIVLFVKKLEDNSRRVMEITECEILEDGARQLHTLYRYHVSETAVEDGKIKVRGEFQKVSTISASLQKRLLENGMPPRLLEQIAGGRMDIDDGKEETA